MRVVVLSFRGARLSPCDWRCNIILKFRKFSLAERLANLGTFQFGILNEKYLLTVYFICLIEFFGSARNENIANRRVFRANLTEAFNS